MKPKPTKFHHKPTGMSEQTCPICGYPAKLRGSHRATTEAEGYSRKYLRRSKSPTGWRFREVGGRWDQSKRNTPKLTERHAERIFKAATLIAQGGTLQDVATEMETSVGVLKSWQRRHPRFWRETLDAAFAKVAEIVRKEAGTDAVLRDPDKYLRMAEKCDKWATEKGDPLFPVGEDPTVSSFFADYFVPVCLSDVKGHNRFHYDHTVKLWRLLTGDPPLKDVTSAMLAKYRDALKKRRGVKAHLRYSAFTVNNKLRHLQTILDKAVPPMRRNRDAAGVLDRVPYVKPLKTILPPRKTVPIDRFIDTCNAAVCATVPTLSAIKPAAWWRAILITALYTGLRRGTLLSLEMDDIHWEDRIIVIPGKRMKSGRPLAAPMHKEVYNRLMAIRTDRKLVFPFPSGGRYFDETLHKIQTAAGIPKEEHFGLQRLRGTFGTMLYQVNPGAATLALGHAGRAVTETHYVRPDEIVSRAVAGLPSLDEQSAA